MIFVGPIQLEIFYDSMIKKGAATLLLVPSNQIPGVILPQHLLSSYSSALFFLHLQNYQGSCTLFSYV